MNFSPELFVQYGIIGIVLGWFMFRLEKKLDHHTSVINDLVIAHALETAGRRDVPEAVLQRANELLERATARKVSMSQ